MTASMTPQRSQDSSQTAASPSEPGNSRSPPTALIPLAGFRPVGAPKGDYRRLPGFSRKVLISISA